MRFKFLIVPAALIFQVAGAQNNSTVTIPQGTVTTAPAASSTAVTPPSSTSSMAVSGSTDIAIMDYKSVYDATTLEEEVQMAAERFNLTKAQQEVWMVAGKDRRATETQARAQIESKAVNVSKDDAYRGLRSAQNTFYETIIGYLNPAQKQALETDRAIQQEKQKRLAKYPPPPPPAPTVTVAPVDSAAIKESEKSKAGGKKSKKKKKGA